MSEALADRVRERVSAYIELATDEDASESSLMFADAALGEALAEIGTVREDVADAVLSARDYLRTLERDGEQPVWWYANRFPRMCETVLLLAPPHSQKEEGAA